MIAIRWMQSIGPALESRGIIDMLLRHASDNIIWGAVIGAVLTAIIHSSAAGDCHDNGTCWLRCIARRTWYCYGYWLKRRYLCHGFDSLYGGTPSGKFVAWSHVILNVAGAVLFLPLLPLLEASAAWLASETATQIAHSQTIFNVVSSLLALPLCYLPGLDWIVESLTTNPY